MKREKLVTGVIILCFIGGLVGGPVASLMDYYGSPEERFSHNNQFLQKANYQGSRTLVHAGF